LWEQSASSILLIALTIESVAASGWGSRGPVAFLLPVD